MKSLLIELLSNENVYSVHRLGLVLFLGDRISEDVLAVEGLM